MEDFSKITISTKQLENGSYVIGSDAEAAFKKIISFINSVTEKRNKYAEEYSRVDPSGYMEKSVFVPKSLLEAVTKRIDAYAGETSGKANGTPFAYKIDPSVKALETTLNLTGAKAQSEAVLAASRIGGSYNKDTGKLIFPKPDEVKNKLEELDYIQKQFKKPMQSSYDVEEAKRQLIQQREDERQKKEDEKFIKEQLKQEEKSQKLNRWWKAEGASAARKYDAEQEKRRQRQKEKEEEDKDENKRENFTSGFFKDPLVKILSLLGITVALIRRIITRLPSQAIQNAKDAVKEDAQTALAMGLTKWQMRDFKVFETAHGIDPGTFAGAVLEVNKAFGDITKLEGDSPQVEKMALLGHAAGNDKLVEDLVSMQVNQEQPDVLMEKILNAAFAAYAKGRDIVTGDYGKEATMLSILNALDTAGFQDLSVLFRQAVEDKEAGIYKDSFKNFTYKDWLATTAKNITGLTDSYLDALKVMGQEFNKIAGKLKDITDSALTKFATSLVKITDWVDNQRIFLSPEENQRLNRENYQKNLADLSKYGKESAIVESSFRKRYKEVTGKELTKDLGKLSQSDLDLLEGDPTAIASYRLWKTYQTRINEAEKQVENYGDMKNVSYAGGENSAEFVRLDTEKAIRMEYDLMRKRLFSPNTPNASYASLSEEARQMLTQVFKEVKQIALTPTAMKGDTKSNAFVKALLALYNKANPSNKIEIGPDGLTEEQAQALSNFSGTLSNASMIDFVLTTGKSAGQQGKNVKNAFNLVGNQKAMVEANDAYLRQNFYDWYSTNAAQERITALQNKGYTPKQVSMVSDNTRRQTDIYVKFEDSRGQIVREKVGTVTGEFSGSKSLEYAALVGADGVGIK